MFLQTLLTMSLLGSLMGLVIILLEYITRRWHIHRGVLVWLWALVALRLLCPVGLTSRLGLPDALAGLHHRIVQSQETAGTETAGGTRPAQTGQTAQSPVSTDEPVWQVQQTEGSTRLVPADTGVSLPKSVVVRPWVAPERITAVLLVWGAVSAGFLAWGVLSYVLFRKRLRRCHWLDVRLEESEKVAVPCVVGLRRPRIYLPQGLTPEQQHMTVTHERCHIRRGDHIWKIVAYGVLSLHWFNPLVWLCYFKFQRDVEMACDELALKELGQAARLDYSQTLLDLSAPGARGLSTPVAFSENSIKSRLQRILRNPKPRRAVTIPVGLLCLVLTLSVSVGATERRRVLQLNQDGTVSVMLPRIEMEVDAEGELEDYPYAMSVYTYDKSGNIIACDYPGGQKGYEAFYDQYGDVEWWYYTGDRGFRYVYDERGRLVECYIPKGLEDKTQRQVYEYDQQDRLIRIKFTDASMWTQSVPQLSGYGYWVVGEDTFTKEYAYDRENRLTHFRVFVDSQMIYEEAYVYREQDRQMLTYASYYGEREDCLVTTWDQDWRIASCRLMPAEADKNDQDAAFWEIRCSYDAQGRLIREYQETYANSPYYNDGGDNDQDVRYRYDGSGNLVERMEYEGVYPLAGYTWYVAPTDVYLETAIRMLRQNPFSIPAGTGFLEITLDPQYRVLPRPGF